MTAVLLTGFEPFEGAETNPSWDAVAAVAASWDGSAEVVAERLPVEFERAVDVLAVALARHSPDVVIATGLAAGRDAVTPERRGLNRDDARIPDNAGDQRSDAPIDPSGPDELPSALPVDAIVAALAEAGIPAHASDSAGGYVCNHVLYRLLQLTAGSDVRAGFIHVPATPETGLGDSVPTLPASTIADAIRIAVETTVESASESGAARAAGARLAP